MDRIRFPSAVDLEKFASTAKNPEIKYGLPREVVFCRRCTMNNQKPNSAQEFLHTAQTKKETLALDQAQVCTACINHEKKAQAIDWERREAELLALCEKYRSRNGSYDCVVPGSGGKDSFFTSYVLKYKYGMNPLTVTWAPHMYTDWGWKNFQAWLHSGFDNYLFTPNGRIHRLLTRLAVETIFHPFQPFMLGQMYFAPKIAAKLGIPLVFYGENAAEYGNPIEENSKAQKDWKYFTADDPSQIFLAGVSLQDLKTQFGLTHSDLDPYLPADPQKLKEAQIDVQYLGYYLKWHPQGNYYFAVENGGFEAAPERTAGTYSKYNSIDDKIDDFHYYTTYIKFGIGRASYDTCQEIRNGELDRPEGVALVQKYDGEYPSRFEAEIFEYLSVKEKELPRAAQMFEQPKFDRKYFMALCDQFRSPHLWMSENGEWKLRKTLWKDGV